MDFEKFYNEQPDYVLFRNDNVKQEEYKTAVDWKARKLSQLIPEGFEITNILEVGCAFGVLLNNLADRLHIRTRTGVDISSQNINVAEKLYPGCVFFQGTLDEFVRADRLGIKDRCFDLTVLSDIIEHIPDDLGFLVTVRKISSYVLLNLPLEKSFKTRNRIYGEQDPSGHLRCYDEEDARRLVSNSGFDILASFTAIGFFDKSVNEIYKKNRSIRVQSKPLPQRLFWSVFYYAEDRIKLINEGFTGKIIGKNYFALLKSNNH